MNIYSARELQKMLFKSSSCSFKRMGIIFSCDKTKIAYFIVHHMSSEYREYNMDMTEDVIERMTLASKLGAIIKIDYLSDERKEKDKLISPVGLYIVELIEID